MATKTFRTRVVVLLAFVIAPLLFTSCRWNQILASWPDHQNILLNGSFEDGTGPGGPFKPDQGNPPAFMSIRPGETTIPNWTVTTGPPGVEVAWAQNDNGPIPNATTDGSHFLDLTGVRDCPGCGGQYGGVTQQFQTKVGYAYHLYFKIGLYGTLYAGPITVVATVSGPGGQNSASLTCGPFTWTDRGPGWKVCETLDGQYFKAGSTTTTLTITGYAPKDKPQFYIGLDSVLVDCVAPLGRHYFCL